MLKNLKGKTIEIDGEKFKVLEDERLMYVTFLWGDRISNRHEVDSWINSMQVSEVTEVLVLQSISYPEEKPFVWVERSKPYRVVKLEHKLSRKNESSFEHGKALEARIERLERLLKK